MYSQSHRSKCNFRKKNDLNTVRKGRQGEEHAARYLEQCGYTVVKKNYRKYGAEIDLIGTKDGLLIFFEVKYWSSFGFGEMEKALNGLKMNKIVKASRGFLRENPKFDEFGIRYDVIYIDGRSKKIKHIESAFTENGAL